MYSETKIYKTREKLRKLLMKLIKTVSKNQSVNTSNSDSITMGVTWTRLTNYKRYINHSQCKNQKWLPVNLSLHVNMNETWYDN